MDAIIRGKIELSNIPGKLFFGRVWEYFEQDDFANDLKDNKINIIWNLTENKDSSFLGVLKFHSPIPDFSIPSDKERFREDIQANLIRLSLGENIYMHCFGGHGRTSIALCCILIEFGYTAEEALEYVKGLTGGPETEEQIRFILDY